jgi:hypothetical protein
MRICARRDSDSIDFGRPVLATINPYGGSGGRAARQRWRRDHTC